MIKLVIFDLDGTLVNSIFDLADSVNFVLEKRGYPVHNTDEYYRFVGNGTLKLIERALPESERTKEIITEVHSEFAKLYEKNCLNKTRPYDGISQLLAEIEKRGIMTAVASNKTDVFAKEIVATLFKEHTFSVVLGKLKDVAPKPDPAIVKMIMSETAAQDEATLYVGDSDVDVLTAKNSGLVMAGCEWGFRGRDELIKAGADYICRKPCDVLEVIDKINQNKTNL